MIIKNQTVIKIRPSTRSQISTEIKILARVNKFNVLVEVLVEFRQKNIRQKQNVAIVRGDINRNGTSLFMFQFHIRKIFQYINSIIWLQFFAT